MTEDQQGNLLSVSDKSNPDFRWTVKRRRFVHHYPRVDGNGTEAARLAGFAVPDVEAHRLLKHAEILAAIEWELRNILAKEGVSDEYLISRWANDERGSAADYFKVNERGEFVARSPDELTEDQKARIKKMSVSNNQFGQNVVIEINDPMKAREMLARISGLLGTESALGDPGETARLIRDAVARMEKADGLGAPEGITTH